MMIPLMKLNKEEYFKWKEIVLSSNFYKEHVEDRNVSNSTKNKYALSLATYCMYNSMTLDELYKEADYEERENIRMKDRKILKRLDNYRGWLLKQGLQRLTIRNRFNDEKWFYKKSYIDIPELNEFKYPRERNLTFKDLPTKEDIQTAIDGTYALSNKALFLFMASSGTAKMETSLLTVQNFIDATKDYHNEITNINNVLKILDGKNNIIPLFEMHREKTNYDYHTCCSPEATQAIINLLKSQPIIKNDDPLFYLSYDGISKAFRRANEKYGWGKIKNSYYFNSHRLRKRHASIIGDYDLANYLQGRKPSIIKETYFFNNPEKVKEEYSHHLNELLISDNYYKDVYSEEYEELLDKNNELNNLVNSQKKQIDELKSQKDMLLSMINDVETKVDNIANANDLTKIQEYISNNELVNKYGLSSIIIGYYKEDVKKEDFEGVSNNYIEGLIMKAYNTHIAFKTLESRDEEMYSDAFWKEIKSTINHYEHEYSVSTGYVFMGDSANKLAMELESYAVEVWENDGEVEMSKVQEIVDSIALRK